MRPTTKLLFLGVICTCIRGASLADELSRGRGEPASERPTIRIEIDARDLPRKLLAATLSIPLEGPEDSDLDQVALWYPKWVPGSHGPGGPIENVAGLWIEDSRGKQLSWRRTAGEPHRIVVDLDEATDAIAVRIRYITNQPSTTSRGHDSYGAALLGIVSPSSILLYREGMDIDCVDVATELTLPVGWDAATALPRIGERDDSPLCRYGKVSLRTFVDSPIMCGRYGRTYNLVEEAPSTSGPMSQPPQRLQVFSESESALDVPEAVLSKFRAMVTQAGLLFRSHPFDQFDILLATTDLLEANGLEHSRSTLNVLPQRALQATYDLKGWERLLIPHEYIHAWCGKYRRPAGMVTSDFHTDKTTELLWVYEGLTQYLGELIEVRSGLMSAEEFGHRILIEIGRAMHQQGRQWRSLADTGACSSTLRASSRAWPRLRRGQDYYMEGMLFWLEADAIIRSKSHGSRSLDDFCREFFEFTPEVSPHPRAFDRDEIVSRLDRIAEFDWDGLIARRMESVSSKFNAEVVDRLGYTIRYTHEPPKMPDTTFRRTPGVDAIDSLGAVFSEAGNVDDLLLDSPADKSGLGPGMTIVGVNGHAWSVNRMLDAIGMTATTGEIMLLVNHGDTFVTHRIEYDGGPRYATIVRRESGPDWLEAIVRPL